MENFSCGCVNNTGTDPVAKRSKYFEDVSASFALNHGGPQLTARYDMHCKIDLMFERSLRWLPYTKLLTTCSILTLQVLLASRGTQAATNPDLRGGRVCDFLHLRVLLPSLTPSMRHNLARAGPGDVCSIHFRPFEPY